ncbi:MAG: MBL fold metallo-hydrolase [Marinilabiliales bacterium]|nr:MAG: MBL fold metallo-hydrolase [Marinilabiliales bacterium]
MKLTTILPEIWRMDGGAAFGVIPKTMWSKFYEPDDKNCIVMTNRCLLVESEDRLVLVETGFGSKRNEKYYQFKYIFERPGLKATIEKAGYKPEDITDVIFTHLHDDHCGGAVDRIAEDQYSIVCPNAKHHVSRAQYESATNPNIREAASFFNDNIDPLKDAGLLNLIEEESELFPGFGLILKNAHTAGQMLPKITTEKGTFVYMSDFIPSVAHISPVWIASVDIDPMLALKEKEAFLREAVDNDYTLVFEHDPVHEACKVEENVKGFVGVPVNLD